MTPLTYEEFIAQPYISNLPPDLVEARWSDYQSKYMPMTFGTPNDNGNYSPIGGTQPFTYGTPNYSGGGFSGMDGTSYGGNPNGNGLNSMAKAIPYGSLALGGIQTVAGLIALRQASKLKLPQYQLTGNMAQGIQQGMNMRNQGFTNSELGAYEQGLGNQTANTFRQAKDLSGGQGASAIYAILNGHNVDARNQLAISDAGLRRQNIAQSNQLNQEEQQLKNMNTAQDIDQYNRTKQAAAGLLQSGIGNIANPMNYFGGLGNTPSSANYFGGLGLK
jgi:hypothetical protein